METSGLSDERGSWGCEPPHAASSTATMARTSPALRMKETVTSVSDKRVDRTSQGRPDAVRIPELQQREGGAVERLPDDLPALFEELRSRGHRLAGRRGARV